MRVLVTGATGFVGSSVVKQLVSQGHEVLALVRPGVNPARLADVISRLKLVSVDLMSSEDLRSVVLELAPHAVLHLGWHGVKGADRNSAAQTLNFDASVALYSAARNSGCRIFVGVGSQAEYGPASGRLAEDSPLRPTTTYGAVKLAVGTVLDRMAAVDGLKFSWLRLFSSYGPGDDPSWLLQYVARKLLARERPELTAAQQVWDYIYVDDVAAAVIAAMDTGIAGFYNLGSGVPRKLRDIICSLRDLIDPSLPLGFGEVPYRPDQVMHLEANIGKITSASGWKPIVDLESGLREVIRWIQENP